MPGYGTAFGRGLILGAGAALLYAAARESIAPARPPSTDARQTDDRDRLIDWELATNVAIRAAGRTPTLHPGARAQLLTQYETMLREIEQPIARYVGNNLSLVNTVVDVLDRPGWIRANVSNFRFLLQPVEQTLGVPPDELRRWIALHEATHAHEFELYPWVRTYLNTSLRQYLRLLIEDMRGRGDENTLLTIVNRFIGNLRQGHNVINALMTPQQRELMSRLQALMALAEGYSNHVMNNVGRALLPNFELIHQRVEHRQRQRSQIEQLFLKITGLSLKMEQYRLGERFVGGGGKQRGIGFANRAWESPEALPSEAEIRDPERWIGRMEAAQVA